MKNRLLSLGLALTLCLGLSAIPAAAAADPYTDDWGNKFSDVLDKSTESFTGYGGLRGSKTVYYLHPDATVHLGKRADKMAYLQVKDDGPRLLSKQSAVDTRNVTYTRDEFEDKFGVYDMYCLLSRNDSSDKNNLYDALYFVFDDASAGSISDFVLEGGGTRLTQYRGSGGTMAIPEGVTTIQGMFMGIDTAAGVTGVSFPKSVREIEGWTFNNCTSLSSVALPTGLQKLGDCAFSGCSRLNSVTVPAGLTEIGSDVFSNCGLNQVILQPGLTGIGTAMFSGCQKLAAIAVPASVTQVGERAFANCSALTSVSFGNGNTRIGADAFVQNSFLGIPVTGMTKLTVTAPAGGTVEAYCRDNGIEFRAAGSVPTAPTSPTAPSGSPASAAPTNDSLTVDGKTAGTTVFKINDNNYFKLRDVAALLNASAKQFSVGYENGLVTITTGTGYAKLTGDLQGPASGGAREALPSDDAISVNGQKVTLTAYKIDGSNYFKLRDLGQALNFYVGWSAERGMYIETGRGYSA